MILASVGSANAMNDTDIVCLAGGLSVIRSTCVSGRMGTREHTQGHQLLAATKRLITCMPGRFAIFRAEGSHNRSRFTRSRNYNRTFAVDMCHCERWTFRVVWRTVPREIAAGQVQSKCQLNGETFANTSISKKEDWWCLVAVVFLPSEPTEKKQMICR